MTDWAARPGDIGAGTALMKYIPNQACALLAIGGSMQTLRILPYIGFRAIGTAMGYVRALHPMRLLRGSGDRLWRRLPRFTRSFAWMSAGREAADSRWQVRRLEGDDLPRIASVLPTPRRGMAVPQRTMESLRYMLSCPIVPMHLYAVEKAGRVRGYFLIASAPGQARIVDCWMDSEEPAAWLSMVQFAVEQGRHDPQAAEIVAWSNDPLLTAALRTSSFHARHETLIQIRAPRGTPLPDVPLRVQMLDNDAAYLHEGCNAFWT